MEENKNKSTDEENKNEPTDEELFEQVFSEENLKAHKKRTPEEVEELLRLMNLIPEDISPVVQTLYSRVPLDKPTEQFQMLELDDHLLQCIKSEESLTFRGDLKEPVVLCSKNRTYEVKEAETSNTCLLVPGFKYKKEEIQIESDERIIEEKEVVGMYNTYLEVRECSPRLSKLLVVLEPSSFKGLEYESLIDKSTLYDWDRIEKEIQASDSEILAILPEYLIAEIDGYYRLVAFEFEARAVPLMIEIIEENSWEMDEVEKEVTYESLKEIIPKAVFDLLFQKYTNPSEKKKDDGTQLYKYDEAKSCRLMAQILLTTYPTNNYNDFMEAWKMGCPDNMTPKEEYLYGVAIVTWNSQSMRKEVMLYSESNLPDNLNKRLDELFKVKEKWTIPEISPYISKFATRSLNATAILTKHARPSTVNGVKYYCAKHGK